MTTASKIRIRGLCKAFGPKAVLHDLEIDVGESVVVIGGSGTGKSVMLKCVLELGATTLLVTHDMASARKIANRIAMIYNGRIIWAGPVNDIDESANPYVDQFINGRADGPIKMEALKP